MEKNLEQQYREQQSKKTVVTFRIFQAICLGIFALGLSMIAGDILGYVKSPISSFSMTTTIFGGLGAIISGILAKQSEKW
jgi:hypothetical protein